MRNFASIFCPNSSTKADYGSMSSMNAESIFILVNLATLLGWVLILLLPYARITHNLIDRMLLPACIAVIYIVLVVLVFPQIPFEDYSFLGLTELFSDPWVMALGWTHLMAFDLVAASWMKQDAHKHKIRHRVMLAPYLLTLFFGPTGLLVYLIFRSNKQSKRKK